MIDAEAEVIENEEPTALELRGRYLKKETEEVAAPNAAKELLRIAVDIEKLTKEIEAAYGHSFNYNTHGAAQMLRNVAGQLLSLR